MNPFDVSFSDDDDEIVVNNDFSEPEESTAVVNNGNQHEETPVKYHIVDFYWLLNSVIYQQKEVPEDEFNLLVIGYNADYSNLRLSFYDLPKENIKQGIILKTIENKPFTTVNVYSETALQLLYLINQKKNASILNTERIIRTSTDWQPTLCKFELDFKSNQIGIYIKAGEKKKGFVLRDWQVIAFVDSLKFLTNNRAWLASLLVK